MSHDPIRDLAVYLCQSDTPCCTCRANAKKIVANPGVAYRMATATLCPATSSYGGYHVGTRCALTVGHSGDHDPQIHGFGKFS